MNKHTEKEKHTQAAHTRLRKRKATSNDESECEDWRKISSFEWCDEKLEASKKKTKQKYDNKIQSLH